MVKLRRGKNKRLPLQSQKTLKKLALKAARKYNHFFLHKIGKYQETEEGHMVKLSSLTRNHPLLDIYI